jgi:large subunit ribosomal protein L29
VSTKHFNELKQMSKDELAAKARELEANVFQARMKQTTGQLEDKTQVWRLRKDLARIKTLQAGSKVETQAEPKTQKVAK